MIHSVEREEGKRKASSQVAAVVTEGGGLDFTARLCVCMCVASYFSMCDKRIWKV